MKQVSRGDTFYFDPEGGSNVHLWVVLSVFRPDYSHTDHAVIVSVTSMKTDADRTCILRPNDRDAHDFVCHESYADYGRCRDTEVYELEKRTDRKRRPVSPALLDRLRNGLHESPRTRRGMKANVPRP